MFIRSLIPPALLLSTPPAMALSCLPPHGGVTDAYQDAAEAEASYVVVLGELTFNESRLPEVDWDNQQATPPEHTLIPSRLEGQALTASGFDAPFSAPVGLDVQCFGPPWCAGAQSGGVEYLAFLKRQEGGAICLKSRPAAGLASAPPPARADRAGSGLCSGRKLRTLRPPPLKILSEKSWLHPEPST